MRWWSGPIIRYENESALARHMDAELETQTLVSLVGPSGGLFIYSDNGARATSLYG